MVFQPLIQNSFVGLTGGASAAAETYQDLVLALSPIAYWPLTEAAGTTATALVGTNGTYARNVTDMGTGAGPIAGQTAPLFTAASTDKVTISAGAITTWDATLAGTVACWAKVSAAGIWTDGATHNLFYFLADGSNYAKIDKTATNNRIRYQTRAGGAFTTVDTGAGFSSLGWEYYAVTWDDTADEMKAYYQGAQHGVTQGSVGTFVGNTAISTIGANLTSSYWDGYLAHCVCFDRALSLAEILSLATP